MPPNHSSRSAPFGRSQVKRKDEMGTRYPVRSSYHFERGLALSTYTGWISGTLSVVALLPAILGVFGLIGMTTGHDYEMWESLVGVGIWVPAILLVAMAIVLTAVAWLRFEAYGYDLIALVFLPIWVLLMWSFAGPYFLVKFVGMIMHLTSWAGIRTLLTELMPFALLGYFAFYRRSDYGDRWQDVVAKCIALTTAVVFTGALLWQLLVIGFWDGIVAKIASPTTLFSPVVLLDAALPTSGTLLMIAFFGSLAYLVMRAAWGD